MLVCCVGDVMLDVLVEAPAGLVPDDDTPARITCCAGGQAANVAAWVAALGGRARVFGPRSAGGGRLVEEALGAHGVELVGPVVEHPGAVVALVSGGHRSLASDPGSTGWLGQVAAGPWLDGADWLFVSGYALLRADDPAALLATAAQARAAGTRVAVDLASAGMIGAFGPARFRALWQQLRPAVVLANEAEWAATSSGATSSGATSSGAGSFGAGGTSVLVLKRGARGSTFVIDGVGDHRDPPPGPVLDVTGAGDALAAGYLLGGADLAMESAARCVARVGAQPAPEGHR